MKIEKCVGLLLLSAALLSGCYKPDAGAAPWKVSGLGENPASQSEEETFSEDSLNQMTFTAPVFTPTPNLPITLPTLRNETLTYTVQRGDTLRVIGQKYQVSVAQISALNEIQNPDLIEVGQVLLIPPPTFDATASSFKIIPDSELVNSPSNAAFNTTAFVSEAEGYLADYTEEIDGSMLAGADIVSRVALEYSVNPRLLLAILEYQSGWVTQKDPAEETLVFPIGYYNPWLDGLYQQLGWAANLLNEGYYRWKINAISVWTLLDSSVVEVDPTINPGTAGVLNLFRYLKNQSEWQAAVSEDGIFSTYMRLFGYPFIDPLEPMIPEDLKQPTLQLPFEPGDIWSFTGGPHGGWNSGSAWAALDFAPPGDALGCFPSSAWVVASAPGEIVYADHGAVIQDLDGDGIWQTGWSILYMHIDSWERVEVGTYLRPGDRIGHPSCEGGFSTGTHLHIARRYNGEWIAADADLPFVMDGWVSVGYGVEYDGYLIKSDITLEAWDGRSPINAIER